MNLRDGAVDPDNPFADYRAADLYQFVSGYTLLRDPGSEFEYSNVGAGLLGHLLAHRAGTDYESLLQSRITQPLRMLDTGITLSSLQKQRMATGHRSNLAPVAPKDLGPSHAMAGAAALRSSVNDLLTFLEAFLGYKETPLAPAVKAMLEIRRPAGQIQIGLGWLIHSKDGREIVWHNGGIWAGFRSFIGYDSKGGIGVVVLSNAFNSLGVDDIGFHLLNPMLPLANPDAPKQRVEIQIDSNLLDCYTGRYQVTPGLILEITREGERLFAQGLGQVAGKPVILPRFELFAEGERNFFAKVADQQITFESGPEGRTTRLILHRAGRDMPAPRLS